jgi:hypothetical protein
MDLVDLLLETLQADLWHRLRSDDVLGGMPILRDRVSSTTTAEGAVDPIDDIEMRVINGLSALNEGGDGKNGSCIIVEKPELETENINLSAPKFDVVLTVRVIVNPLLNNDAANGRRMSEGQLALRVMRLGHYWMPGGVADTLTVNRKALSPGSDLPDGHEGYDVEFRTKAGLAVGPNDKVLTPRIAVADGVATLTCATDDAIIYFTTDGSAPAPTNEGAQEYGAPFAVESGTRIRAAAQLAGRIASDTAFFDAP